MKRNILAIVILVFAIIFAWYKILFQVPLGEGYYYFDQRQNFFRSGLILHPLGSYLASYDNLPRLIFDILPPLLKDNLMFYQAFELLSLILLSITIYFVSNYVFKNKWISFMATFFFSTSYVGLFEMIGTGNYQRFIQRIPNFIPLFIAFGFLAKYFDTKKIKYYFTSIIIFALTVFMAHYSTFLLPLFLIYPLITLITFKRTFKNLFKNVEISISYLLVNYFLIKNDFYNPGVNLSSILPDSKNFIDLILLQLSNITYPPSFLNSIGKVAQPYTKTVSLLSIPIILIYLVGIYLVKKREPKYLTFYLTSILTLFSILFLNFHIGKIDYMTFVRGDRYYFISIETLSKLGVSFVGGSRYYVLPIIFNSIIVSTILWVLLKNKKGMFYFSSTIILAIYLVYNISLIWKEIDQIQPVSERMKIYINYTKSISSKLQKSKVVVTPPEFIWSGQFVRLFYGNDNLKFIPLKSGWEKPIDKEGLNDTVIINCNEKECKQQ